MPADPRTALADLVHQIELAEFTDELGHPLKMNQAYLDARQALQDSEAAASPGAVPPEYRTWETGP